MDYIMDFESFVNESIVTVKRKYTDAYPETRVSNYAPIRERILSFVRENKKVTKAQLYEFIRSLNEGSHRTASVHWVTRNERYFNVKEAHGTKYYSLSKLGERVFNKINTLN